MEQSSLRKIKQVFKICANYSDSEEKINLMLRNGWVILETIKDDYGHPVERHERLYVMLGHEDADAEVPMTESEMENEKLFSKFNQRKQPFD